MLLSPSPPSRPSSGSGTPCRGSRTGSSRRWLPGGAGRWSRGGF